MSTADQHEIARGNLRLALGPFFKSASAKAKLEDAVTAALNSVISLIPLEPTRQHNVGATVMTESAAARSTVRPKNL